MATYIIAFIASKRPYHEWVGEEQLEKPLVITYYSNLSLSCFVPFEMFGGVYNIEFVSYCVGPIPTIMIHNQYHL